MAVNKWLARTVVLVSSATCCVAEGVVDLPGLCGFEISTPAAGPVGQAHDVLAQLQTHELAVARTLKAKGSVVLKRGPCRKAANCGHCIGGQRRCGRCDGVLYDCRCRRGGLSSGR
jgi:hypothetical protein